MPSGFQLCTRRHAAWGYRLHSKDKKKFPFRNVYMWVLLATMLFPPSLIPLFFTVRDLKLAGTIWSLVLPGAVGQFYIILIMNYFRSLPVELDESASIDGATPGVG